MSLAALSRGDTVIRTSRTPGTRLSDIPNRGVTTLKLDLTSTYPEIAFTVAEALRQHETIDVLVSVAGYLLEGSVKETNEQEPQYLYKTSFSGPTNLARALLQRFRARRAGIIANVADIGALRGAHPPRDIIAQVRLRSGLLLRH